MKTQKLVVVFLCVVLCGFAVLPVATQGACPSLPTRLTVGQMGQVAFTDGQPLNVRAVGSRSGAVVGRLAEGTPFEVLGGPSCADDIAWWQVKFDGGVGWIAEAVDGVYLVEPQPGTSVAPTAAPVIATDGLFAAWDWSALADGDVPDPMMMALPVVYAGNMPSLPVELAPVLFVDDAKLSSGARALLAQNGFVVVPEGAEQFSDAYREFEADWQTVPDGFDWQADPATQELGHPMFVTTDSMLHALHYIFDNLLSDLEREALVQWLGDMVAGSLQSAATQYQQAIGTPLEAPARNAVLYLLVAARLMASDAPFSGVDDAPLIREADAIAALALAGEGQEAIPFLTDYREDFSQYRPRGHYAGEPILENYFRGMMWLSRITFRAKYDDETLTGLLLLRALRTAPDAYATWQSVSDILAFLVGPVDDLGPPEYAPLADEVFGADMSLSSLSDAGKLADFRARVEALPGPRINSLVLPASTEAEDVEVASRGFRLMGQRFTLDSYVLQRLMYPYVGTEAQPRVLPLGLDIPSANGSSLAADLIAQAGADDFVNYDTEMNGLRQQITSLTPNDWLENTYGGWLWTLQPLWMREPAGYPPLMRTDAWLRRDLNAGLASWTELRHDTVLYVKQPTGFGGGGPPLASYGYVEPNPLVFARIAIVAGLLYQGLDARGTLDPARFYGEPVGLMTDMDALRELAVKAGSFADAARRELTGDPLDDDTYYAIQTYGTYLDVLLRTLYQGSGTPDPVALVTDVASNTTTLQVLQEGVGVVDYIYVVIPAPGDRLQLARGAVFSYYEFVGDINERMTDAEWRELVVNGNLPPRPDWTAAYLSN